MPEYRGLYQALLALQRAARSHVDLARLQLAVRSLESLDPVIRVALVGLGANGADAAGKLARVLLSDPLAQEQDWEKDILVGAKGGRSLLPKSGATEDNARGGPLSLNVPSPLLRGTNLAFAITIPNIDTDLQSSGDQTGLQEEAVLVPSQPTPNSAGGRVSVVRYPVHKAIVVAEGVSGAVELGRFLSKQVDGALIKVALSVPLRSSASVELAEQEATSNAVDLDLANHALELFRSNNADGAQFSEEWQRSRVQALSEWITGPEHAGSTSSLNPAVYNLISSILTNTSTSISQSEAAETANATAATVSEARRTLLQDIISAWSADAHRDLQQNLDAALSDSSSWRRTAWWRLFWRIDDVTISASEVLRGSWLTEAEQSLAFLSGRISEAGLETDDGFRALTPTLLEEPRKNEMQTYEALKAQRETAAELKQMPSMLARMQAQSGVNALFDPPWPQIINLTRQYMLHTLVPELHRRAQRWLVGALSTIGGSVAFGTWLYVVTSGAALYESGAIVALGLVWSLGRLQKLWGTERNGFASTVHEGGRFVLGEVEAELRKMVSEGGRVNVRPEDVESWREAREAVQRCREAMEKLGK